MSVTSLAEIRKSKGRDAVSNGKYLFADADHRSKWARRFRFLMKRYTDHIGGNPTVPQQSLIRRIVTLDIETERMEGLLASGVEIDRELYNRLVGNQRRALEQLGMHAQPHGGKPQTLAEIAARRSA